MRYELVEAAPVRTIGSCKNDRCNSGSRFTASRRTASAAPCVAKVEEASHHVLVKALTEEVVRYSSLVPTMYSSYKVM